MNIYVIRAEFASELELQQGYPVKYQFPGLPPENYIIITDEILEEPISDEVCKEVERAIENYKDVEQEESTYLGCFLVLILIFSFLFYVLLKKV